MLKHEHNLPCQNRLNDLFQEIPLSCQCAVSLVFDLPNYEVNMQDSMIDFIDKQWCSCVLLTIYFELKTIEPYINTEVDPGSRTGVKKF